MVSLLSIELFFLSTNFAMYRYLVLLDNVIITVVLMSIKRFKGYLNKSIINILFNCKLNIVYANNEIFVPCVKSMSGDFLP